MISPDSMTLIVTLILSIPVILRIACCSFSIELFIIELASSKLILKVKCLDALLNDLMLQHDTNVFTSLIGNRFTEKK